MLKIASLYKSFSTTFAPALNNINLEVASGEFCVIIGSNGSGKSTLLKTITGDYSCDSGKIILDEKNITSASLYERSKYISSVTQDINLGTIGEMTLLENMVLSFLRDKKDHFTSYQKHASYFLDILKTYSLGLEKYLHTSLGFLSGGQRQTIATLMAFLTKPRLLVLDEHTSALDPKAQSLLMGDTSRRIQAEKITTLMVTHDLKAALLYGDRLLMMHQGKIVLDMKKADKKDLDLKTLQALFYQYAENS